MSSITGPKIQVPNAIWGIHDSNGVVRAEWQGFFHGVQQTVFNVSRSGPTASRPTSQMDGRFIGMPYYDTDLGKAVYLHSVNPDVWHDGAGNAV